MHRRSATRSLAVALTVALACLVAPVPTAAQQTSGATVDKTNWWNRANETVSNPVSPVTAPPPPGVPAGDLVVSTTGGETTAVAGIGILPDDTSGTLQSASLSIAEDDEANGNQGTGSGAIVACPITDFFTGGFNSQWSTRPAHDCEAATVEGTRADDGRWTFDLTTIAALWFDADGIPANGVMLLPAEESTPFQAVLDPESIVVEVRATGGGDGDGGFSLPPTTQSPTTTSPSPQFGGGSPPPNIFSPPTTGAGTTPPPIDDGTAGTGDGSTDEPADDGTGGEVAAPEDGGSGAPPGSERGNIFGNLSPAVVVGLVVLLALMGATSYWFGPAGQPVTTIRQRGVSRALAARTANVHGDRS